MHQLNLYFTHRTFKTLYCRVSSVCNTEVQQSDFISASPLWSYLQLWWLFTESSEEPAVRELTTAGEATNQHIYGSNCQCFTVCRHHVPSPTKWRHVDPPGREGWGEGGSNSVFQSKHCALRNKQIRFWRMSSCCVNMCKQLEEEQLRQSTLWKLCVFFFPWSLLGW